MHQSAIPAVRFSGAATLPVVASFDGGRLTSDGGLPWLERAEQQIGVCRRLAKNVPEWRRGPVRHPLALLVRQRVFQIASGYADQNDATTLRTDPLLKVVCGRLPETGRDLASQPTLSRLENAVDRASCYRLAVALGQVYLHERERAGIPARILIDVDGTDDPAHGHQEGIAFHGYYGRYMYHPLLLFDGDTNQLITAVLRRGNTHGSTGVLAVPKRVVAILRKRWPEVSIALRMDSAGGVPSLMAWCEQAGLEYTLGLATNPRLQRLVGSVQAEARQRGQDAGAKVRVLGETPYQAGSWPHARRVIVKAELLAKGLNTRFVVTNRTDAPASIYAHYTARGETENRIKDLKRGCFADRLSDHRFWANQFRLLLHAAAYWLLDTIRRWLPDSVTPPLQLDTLRLLVVKIGGRLWQQAHTVRLRLAASHPGQALWQHMALSQGLRE